MDQFDTMGTGGGSGNCGARKWSWPLGKRQGWGLSVGEMSPAAGGNQASEDGGQVSDPEMSLREQAKHPADGKFTTGTVHSPQGSDTAIQAAGQNKTHFEVGDEVKNPVGGSGVVQSIEDGILTVKTDDGKTEQWQAVKTEKRERGVCQKIEFRW